MLLTDSCRVRVAVRLRPKKAEDLAHGSDFDSCVELQPEVSLFVHFIVLSATFECTGSSELFCFLLCFWSCCLQCKKLKLKKNNWTCESYKFDEVFSENASQKRVYEVVAKPVVEASHEFHYFV